MNVNDIGNPKPMRQARQDHLEYVKDVADLLRGTQEAGRRLEIAVYVTIGITLVQFFNLIFEIFRKHR